MKLSEAIDFHPKLFGALRHYNMTRLKEDVTAIIGGFLVSFFGGNSVQIGGPTGAFIVIVYNIIAQFGLHGLAIATFMAGVILLLMGVFRLGTVIKFIPYPIVVGFTAGIALTIFSTQINDFFGLGLRDVPGQFIPKWIMYFKNFGNIALPTLATGLVSLLIIIFTPRISK